MPRRKFSREFKTEAVRLVTDQGVAVSQAARDLDLSESVLRLWMRELSAAPAITFPGDGQAGSKTASSPMYYSLAIFYCTLVQNLWAVFLGITVLVSYISSFLQGLIICL